MATEWCYSEQCHCLHTFAADHAFTLASNKAVSDYSFSIYRQCQSNSMTVDKLRFCQLTYKQLARMIPIL